MKSRAMTLRTLFVTGLSLVLGACASLSSTQDLGAVLRARIAAGYVEPFKSQDVDRWVQIFADDALALHNGPAAMKGRAQIHAFGEAVKGHFEVRTFEVVVDEVRRDGRWALTAGHYTADFRPRSVSAYAGAIGPRQGKFLFVWEQQGGVWRIIADMGNSTDPAPAR
jgi:ketosteroid isomerase-like protein